MQHAETLISIELQPFIYIKNIDTLKPFILLTCSVSFEGNSTEIVYI